MAGVVYVVAVDEKPRTVGVSLYRAVVVDALPFAAPRKVAAQTSMPRLVAALDRVAGPDGRDVGGESTYAVAKSNYLRPYLLEFMNGLGFRTDLLNVVRRRWPSAKWRTHTDGQFWCAVAYDGARPVGLVAGNKGDGA